MTDETKEHRKEQRLSYHWLMQFAGSVKEPPFQGRMVDISSEGAAFVCSVNNNYPPAGKLVTTRFSVPRFDCEKSFESVNFIRIGRVCRVDKIDDSLRRIAIQFARPLPFEPGKQPISKYDRIYKLATNGNGLTPSLAVQFDPINNKGTIPKDYFAPR